MTSKQLAAAVTEAHDALGYALAGLRAGSESYATMLAVAARHSLRGLRWPPRATRGFMHDRTGVQCRQQRPKMPKTQGS